MQILCELPRNKGGLCWEKESYGKDAEEEIRAFSHGTDPTAPEGPEAVGKGLPAQGLLKTVRARLGLVVGIQYQSASSTARTYLRDLIGLCMGEPLGAMEVRSHGSVSHVMGKISVHSDPVSTHGRSPFERIVAGVSDFASKRLDRRNLSRRYRSKRHTGAWRKEGCPGEGGAEKARKPPARRGSISRNSPDFQRYGDRKPPRWERLGTRRGRGIFPNAG